MSKRHIIIPNKKEPINDDEENIYYTWPETIDYIIIKEENVPEMVSIDIPIIIVCNNSKCDIIKSKSEALLFIGSTAEVTGEIKGFKQVIKFNEEQYKFTEENNGKYHDIMQNLLYDHVGIYYSPTQL